jgi:hypothetical protein
MSGKTRKPRAKPVSDDDHSEADLAESLSDMKLNKSRAKPVKKVTVDVLMRNADIARSKISVLIDNLDDNDAEATLKRNVTTAIKHLKDVYALLEY